MEDEEYIEVDTEEDYEDFTASDFFFIGFATVIICVVITVVCKQLRKTFKKVHLKIGDKVELGVDTKD